LKSTPNSCGGTINGAFISRKKWAYGTNTCGESTEMALFETRIAHRIIYCFKDVLINKHAHFTKKTEDMNQNTNHNIRINREIDHE